MTSVEQIKGKRAGVGLRASDPALAAPGYTLFAPLTGGGAVYLIDLQGEIVHQWRMPYSPGLYGRLTEHGTLIYNGKVPEESERFIADKGWKGGAILEMSWDGVILWELKHPDHHHDGIVLANGNVLFLCLGRVPDEIARVVLSGGEPHDLYADYLVEMTRAGEIVWEWRSWEHLDPVADKPLAVREDREEWTHGNTVAELPNGDLLVSFRDLSTIAIIDRQSGDLRWRYGAPNLAQQHAPAPLPNGNILVFDNGTRRVDHFMPYSRVLEIDPRTSEIVWSYQERQDVDFFAPHLSNAQRLPNGNTLICEGTFGRIIEVTAAGETVWEYVNPFYAAPPNKPEGPVRNALFRAYRYPPEQVKAFLRRRD
ncbi:MAG TPA: aryl-sulfate sulfotransferase [Nitrolancea sp.]|nr:aryl-sulfate sulfotransferase [Nitrolancea sp.]